MMYWNILRNDKIFHIKVRFGNINNIFSCILFSYICNPFELIQAQPLTWTSCFMYCFILLLSHHRNRVHFEPKLLWRPVDVLTYFTSDFHNCDNYSFYYKITVFESIHNTVWDILISYSYKRTFSIIWHPTIFT